MIQEFITIHDRFQFEIKQRLPFRNAGKKRRYVIETLFFIPNSLGINERTYTKQMFYNRLKNYIRLGIPELPDPDTPDQDPSMSRVLCALEQMKQKDNQASRARYRDSVKLYALMLKRRLRQGTLNAGTRTGRDQLHHILGTVHRATAGAGLLRRHEEDRGNFLDGESKQALAYCNEYISMCLTYYLLQMLDSVNWDQKDDGRVKLRKKLMKRIHNEFDYQKQFRPSENNAEDQDHETLIYRWNVLKKYVSSPLFLEIRQKKEGTLVLQLVSCFAAGLAMFFATAVAFIGQDMFGALSPNLFLALVIGYIFKDRMKEGLRNFLSSRLRKTFSDRRQFVYQDFGTLIGKCKEVFYFIKNSRIPPSVLALRNKNHLVDIENSYRSEDVMYYRKEILIKPKSAGEAWEGLMDITRLNISDFLNNTDDPTHMIFVPQRGSYQKTAADKVYHMTMIRCHRTGGREISKRFRIVFNRDGIKRIDHIDS